METLQTPAHIQTRCPNCQTVFEISDKIVDNDDPRVRCGECYAIFNARENMLISSLSDDLLLDAEPDDDVLLALDNVAELNLDSDRVYFEPDEGEDYSQGFSDSDLFSAEAQLPEVDYLEDDEEIPELDFESIDPEDDQFDGTLFDDVSIDQDYGDDIGEHESGSIPWNSDSEESDTRSVGYTSDTADAAILNEYQETPDFMRPASEDGTSNRWKTRALMALALVVGLGGLYAYSNRNRSNEFSIATLLNDTLCRITGCAGDVKASIGDLRVIRRNVYTHPKVEKALVINIVFRNDADFDQPYPTLAIQMSDITGKVVAQRDFLPHEYLRTQPDDELPIIETSQVVDVSLEVNDPGDSAKSFELEFK